VVRLSCLSITTIPLPRSRSLQDQFSHLMIQSVRLLLRQPVLEVNLRLIHAHFGIG